MSKIIDRALDIINDRLKTQTSELSPTMEVRQGMRGMAHGGYVLEDDYPTHYLPDVGRQVMADGGMPGRPDISQYLQQIQAQQAPMRQPPAVSDYAYTGAARPQGYEPNRPSWVAPGEYVQSFQDGSPTPYVYGYEPPKPAPVAPQAVTSGGGGIDPMQMMFLMRAMRGFAEGGMPDDDDPVARALQTAQSISQEPMPDMTPRPTMPSVPSAEGRVTAPKQEEPTEPEGMTAYHGTPHEFEQFDTSKIGTGEGVQAYGHGLYFAENENVAKDYRDRLTDKASSFRVENIDMPKWILRKIESHPDRAQAISEIRNDFQNRLAEAEKEAKGSHQPWMASGKISTAKDVLAGLDKIETGANIPHTRGRMYEVRLDVGPEHLLDWDKPLSEQPAYQAVRQHWDDKVGDPDIILKRLDIGDDSTGRDLYEALGGGRRNPENASKALSEMGLRGIRYLDAGSRGKDGESGSHNIVIFDPQHIKIKRRYAEGGDVPERDDEGVIAYAFGNSVPHIEQRIAGGEFPEATDENQRVVEHDLLRPIGQSKMIGDEDLLFNEGMHSAGIASNAMNNKRSIRYLHHDAEGAPIGALQIMTHGPRSKKATIQNIYVAQDSRRQKIATGLLKRARQDYDVRHSGDLTTQGKAFAKATKAYGGAIAGPNVVETHEDIQPAMGVAAYHGSPHEFDMPEERFSKTAAYHYLADSPETAKKYGKNLYRSEIHPKNLIEFDPENIGPKQMKVINELADRLGEDPEYLHDAITGASGNFYGSKGSLQDQVMHELRDMGHDAVRFPDVTPGGGWDMSTVVLDPSIIKKFERQERAYGGAIAGPNVVETHEDIQPAMGMTAYHGSPHEFEQFDTSKIGTGEGAQAYGHGLYFAENEDVARQYRENLSEDNLSEAELDAKQALDQAGWNKDTAISNLRSRQSNFLKNFSNTKNESQLKDYNDKKDEAEKIINEWSEKGEMPQEKRGHMYEVRLNVGPEHLLDWEREFKDQHPNVKSALKDSGIYKAYRDNLSDFSTPMQTRNKNMRGENIHEFISHKLGGPQAAAQKLSDLGIRGIRYFDAGSRDKKRGSKNIVIFDPKHIQTVRRYAEGGGIKAYFMHAPREMGERLQRAFGGAITPIELNDNNLEDEARRLILWSYAVAPLGRPLARAEGGAASDPVDKAANIVSAPDASSAQNAVSIARNLTPMGFYSAAAEAASKIPQRAPIDQILNKVKGSTGVKAEELDWSGVKDAFAGQRSVDPQEVARHFQGNLPQISEKVYGGKPPGGIKKPHSILNVMKEYDAPYENLEGFEDLYRVEPVRGKTYWIGEGRNGQFHLHGSDGTYYTDHDSLQDANEAAHMMAHGRDPVKWKTYNGKPLILPEGENYREVVMHMPKRAGSNEPKFISYHWPQENVLAHLRMQDRVGPDGKKALHIEEIQSDWAQKGRDEGFAPEVDENKIKELQKNVEAARLAVQRARNTPEKPGGITPLNISHPSIIPLMENFENAQNALSQELIKGRGIPHGPYVTDTNSWTDLALKRALKEAAEGGYDKMVWTPGETQADRYNLVHSVKKLAFDPLTKKLFVTPIGKDEAVEAPGVFTKDNLRNFVGKGVAEKLLAAEPQHGIHALEGDQLSTSGEGMKNFYDRIVPSRLQALVKKLDPEAKISLFSHDLPAPEGEGTIKGHVLHITPKLRAAILRGLPAYAEGGSVDDENSDDSWEDAFHATHANVQNFNLSKAGSGTTVGGLNAERAIFLTNDPQNAHTYLGGTFVKRANAPYTEEISPGVGRHYTEGANIMPLKVNTKDFDEWDYGGGLYDANHMKQIIKEARQNKVPGIKIENIKDQGYMGLGSGKKTTTYVVLDPSRIRSRFAAFDPKKSNKKDLMASSGGSIVNKALEVISGLRR